MVTQLEKQQDAVRRMKQSPCQCLEYHPKKDTEIYNEMMNEYKAWRNSSRKVQGTVDKTWILIHLLASQSCPFIKEEGK